MTPQQYLDMLVAFAVPSRFKLPFEVTDTTARQVRDEAVRSGDDSPERPAKKSVGRPSGRSRVSRKPRR